MKIQIEIDTTEELTPPLVLTMVGHVLRLDLVCRQRYGPDKSGKTRGEWNYSRSEDPPLYKRFWRSLIGRPKPVELEHTLHYTVGITRE